MKVAFILGHTSGQGLEKDQGEYSPFLQKTEWNWYNQFSGLLSEMGDVFYHDENVDSYNKRQKLMAKRTKDYDLAIELHFNSFSKASANGCECWHNETNYITEVLSKEFCRLFTKEYGTRNRGNKPMKRGQRGGTFIFSQQPNAILIEPFFGSNEEDCRAVNNCPQNLFTKVLPDTIKHFEKLINEN